MTKAELALASIYEMVSSKRNEIRTRREMLTGTLIIEERLLKDEQDFLDEIMDKIDEVN